METIPPNALLSVTLAAHSDHALHNLPLGTNMGEGKGICPRGAHVGTEFDQSCLIAVGEVKPELSPSA